jgi:hypothetical protein
MINPSRAPGHVIDVSTELAVPVPVEPSSPAVAELAVQTPVVDQLTINDTPLSPTFGEQATLGGQKADPAFCMSEDALSRIEAALRTQERKHIPRAGQLPPVSGLAVVEDEVSPQTAARAPTLSFQPSPPLAPERLQSVDADKRPNAQIFWIILIAGAMSAPLAYHFLTTDMSPEHVMAKGAGTQVPSPPPQVIEAQVNHPTPKGASNQLDTNPEDGQRPQSPVPIENPVSNAPVLTESSVSLAPVLARSVPIESTANTAVLSPIHHSRGGRHSGARSKSQ